MRGAAVEVGADAAHPVVRGGGYGDGSGGPVEVAGAGGGVDGGEALGQVVGADLAVMASSRTGWFSCVAIWRAMPRATTSRGASSAAGWMCCMKRWCWVSRRVAPSPRTASEMRKVLEVGTRGWGWRGRWGGTGRTRVSASWAPARRAMATPSPVATVGLVVWR